jgi:uncharacterized RDD family membrane protein YckC
MNQVDHYIADVMKNVFASKERKEQFEGDLRAHIEEKVAAGESLPEVLKKMGEPEAVAGEFMAGTEVKLAGFWVRLLAFLLDMHICLAVGALLFLFLYMAPHKIMISIFQPDLVAPMCPADIATVIQKNIIRVILLVFFGLSFAGVMLLYFPAMEALFGWTLGKRLLRLRVIKERIAKINLGDAILRRLSFYFDILLVDALFIPFTKQKQRAFDIIAKTLVIRETYLKMDWTSYAAIILIMVALPLAIAWIFLAKLVTMNVLWAAQPMLLRPMF